MGYTIKIGDAIVEIDTESSMASIDVKDERHTDAPAHGEPTDYTNERWPSYDSWSNVLKFSGLYDMFFNDDDGIMRQHPGAFPIEQKHLDKVKERISVIKKNHPNAIAGYAPINQGHDWPECNTYLVRLEWLEYWFEWSLNNCNNPVIANW